MQSLDDKPGNDHRWGEIRLPRQFRNRLKLSLCWLAAIGVMVFTYEALADAPAPGKNQEIGFLPKINDSDSAVPPNGPPSPLKPVQAKGEETITGFPPLLATIGQKPARSSEDLGSFVENLGSLDAGFEVIVGEGRLLTLKENLASAGKQKPLIAVGDPSVIDFNVVGPRHIRIVGMRIGATDLSITSGDGKIFSFEVNVVPDLVVLRAQLKAVYPGALIKLSMIRDHVVVEGQARDTAEITHILETIRAYLASVQATQTRKISGQASGAAGPGQGRIPNVPRPTPGGPEPVGPPGGADPMAEPGQLSVTGTVTEPRIINLMRVPGSQQVLLKVRVAELNRTAMREIGADILAVDSSGAIGGTQIGGAGIAASGNISGSSLLGSATGNSAGSTTVFGIFPKGDWEFFLHALRKNEILKILAEPNLVTLHGHDASFLAGGEFPVPVPQVGASGVAPTVTVQFREFGVRLNFVPYIEDGDTIRLKVDPEVSNIDFSLGTTLVAGGSPVPGLNTRKAHTTVEMKQGQTLMIAGLMQLQMDGHTSRIPLIGDLPIIGPFFSNTTSGRVEKELVVLVTPYLVEPLNPDMVPCLPGEEVKGPTDLELYLLGRLEGRTGRDFRATTEYDDPLHLIHHLKLERKYLAGPCGFSECGEK
ncbi:MAG TPA: pilus assembly protein N-terminal domain-containing protein [Gemmataceae bacterium]|jgi:pilus assembly protein CpaC|nr:pilus assembly protein N-terminal domain-containing protein [Gemmataceae bacterium]